MGLLKKAIKFLSSILNRIQNYILLKIKNVKYQKYPFIKGRIKIWGNGRIILGTNVSFNSGSFYNPIGGDKQMILKTGPKSSIEIGDYTGISNSAIVSYNSVKIGSYVKIGGSVKIYDTDFHNLDYKKRAKTKTDIPITKNVEIKDYSFIGAHSIILKGVTIGEKSIVGAGSVVTKNIPSGEIWAGNPAKFIKKITP